MNCKLWAQKVRTENMGEIPLEYLEINNFI